MSNFSKEKVLEWVNSSEARAAKYEQEAKVTQQYDHNNCIGHPQMMLLKLMLRSNSIIKCLHITKA